MLRTLMVFQSYMTLFYAQRTLHAFLEAIASSFLADRLADPMGFLAKRVWEAQFGSWAGRF